jgi:hypothetical protein
MVLDEDGNEVTTNMSFKQLRYMPITPRLKRLFLNQETTKQMRWHKEGDCQDQDLDIMVHPSDGKAWQALVRFDLEFTRDLRSVCLGLSMDGFTPYTNNSTSYLCWPVFMMPYNLPPIKCMKEGVLFLALIVPGPKDPVTKINVFMQPLIEELKLLWQWVEVYDSHLLHIFDALCRFPIGDGVVPRRSYSRRSSSSSGTNRPRRASAREEELLEKVRQMEERMAQYQQQVSQQMQQMQSQYMMHNWMLQQVITPHLWSFCRISKSFN